MAFIKNLMYRYWFVLLGTIILLASFLLRVINLNYNSAFNDEAIYVVLGKMGVFDWDWWSYNARAWVAGLPYIYPSLSALAYVTGGLVGTRFLSVLFGIMAIEAVAMISFLLSKKDGRQKASFLITAAVFGLAGVSLYVSRLATLDIPAFAFLFLGIASLIWVFENEQNSGKLYFLSFIFIFFAFLTKIIAGIYIPFVLVISFLAFRTEEKKYFFFKRYFLFPMIISLFLYGFLEINFLRTYASTQASRELYVHKEIFSIFLENSILVLVLWAIGSLGMIFFQESRKWFLLNIGALLVLFFHLYIHRTATLDKHTDLSVAFLSIIVGIGFSNIIWLIKKKGWRIFIACIFSGMIIWFAFFSFRQMDKYNHLWANDTLMLEALTPIVQNGDKVLTETGASTILALYDKESPFNITTFDWFEYRGLRDEKAYATAVSNGYFDVIQLEGKEVPKDSYEKIISDAVWESLGNDYKQLYAQNSFYIYKRTY